jgi:YHS domain-containing protein
MTPIRILAKGCFTASLSAVLLPASWADAQSSLKPGSRQPASAKRDSSTTPRSLSNTTDATARPLILDQGVIQSVSSDRRLQRMKRKEQLLQGKADLSAAAKTAPQEPQQQQMAQPQQQIVRPAPMVMQPSPQMNFAPTMQQPTSQPQFSAPTAQSNVPEMDMATGEFVEPSLEGDDRSPDPEPRPMTKIEMELQRLYAEHNMQVPTMPQVVPVTPQAQAAQPQMNAAQPQQGMAQQRPMAPSKAAPMARAKMLQPDAATQQEMTSSQPAQEPAKPKKSFLGFFGIKRHAAPKEQPPEEPDPYVPVNARPMPGMTAEVVAPAPVTAKPIPQPDATRGAESVVITTEPAVHPLATPSTARNYSQQLFGAPTAAPAAAPVEAPTTVIVQPSHSDLGIEELDREPEGADNEDLSFDLGGTPTMQLGPAPGVASLPDAEPAMEAPAELPSPFSGMKLNESAYAPDPADPFSDRFEKAPEEPSLDLDSAAMAPGEPREVSLGNTPQKTGVPTLIAPSPTQVRSAKLEMIASRAGLPGLKGFCPVRLRDHRQLVDGESRWSCEYEGRTYHMSSSAACERFKAEPAVYAPAAHGLDTIELAAGHEVEGSLDYAVWYQGRLYLFASQQSQETFVNSPQVHTAQ